jgi:exopolyphosphatase/guanosine-5'-triphosphate,3'-diphosphate pyrophosphatase
VRGLIKLLAAAIDIGTNSCRLLIGENNYNNQIQIITRELKITRLGEGVDKQKKLNQKAVNRVLSALKYYKNIIDEYNIDKTRLIGTSALRDVDNSYLLSKEAAKLGFELEIISGEKEAELNYLGAVDNLNDDFLLIDIGGGSTEFIWLSKTGISFESLNIGCVRLTERFISDPELPLKENEIREISNFVYNLLKSELNIKKTLSIKGVGGTITTLAAVKMAMEDYSSEKIEGAELYINELKELLNKFRKSDLNDRSRLKGLQPKRADIIPAGLIILLEILEYISSESLTVSDHDLLYGLLKEELKI